ncbi:MAG: C40 family peptidase [Bacteroidales bacterium]|nr:C40 family peptidase [Bacteroidales bacterium]
MYGVANLSVLNLRAEPSHRSELVSQMLFGDAYSVVEETPDWLRVRTCDCGYEGWISRRQHNPLHDKDVEDYLAADKYVVKDLLLIINTFEKNISFPIFIGSSFPYPKDGILILGNSIFMVNLPEEKPVPASQGLSPLQVKLMQFAAAFLNAPYLWGGRTPAGIDCSGFSQLAYKSVGIALPRDASQQVEGGAPVDFVEEAQVGDLAFFGSTAESETITHVGIVCGQNKIIHSSGKVRIDTLDSTGIFCNEEGRYTHFLRIIKRVM